MLVSATYANAVNMKMNASEKNALLETVMQGRLDFFRSDSVCSLLPNAEFQDTDQNALYASGMDYACCNGVIEKNQSRIPTDDEIDRVIEFFSSKGLPFIWWTEAKLLETKGFQFGGTLTGIALDISQAIPSDSEVLSHLEIKIVESEEELSLFSELAANGFGMNPKAAGQFLAINASVMKQGEAVHFLAYFNETLVGTVTLSTSKLSAGIWNLVTLPEYRKHGIGVALVRATLIEAQRRQYGQVMAILMPKGMAWGLFTKLGFKEACSFPFYVYGVSAEELEK